MSEKSVKIQAKSKKIDEDVMLCNTGWWDSVVTKIWNDLKPPKTTYNHLKNIYNHSQTIEYHLKEVSKISETTICHVLEIRELNRQNLHLHKNLRVLTI